MSRHGEDSETRRFDVPGRPRAHYSLAWAARSDIGHRRQVNEDSVIVQPPIFAVADGMGGHSAGDRASAAAVARLGAATESGYLDVAELDAALRLAAEDIDEIASGYASGAGTTVSGAALALFDGTPGFLVFNIGDSRVYGFAADRLERLTVDHSVVQELVDAGLIAADDAESHPEANVITRALGFHELPRPDLWGVPFRAGLRLLICSDGLTKELHDARIGEILAERRPAADTADLLVAEALEAGGRDNVSIIVVDVLETPPATRRQGGAARRATTPRLGAT